MKPRMNTATEFLSHRKRGLGCGRSPRCVVQRTSLIACLVTLTIGLIGGSADAGVEPWNVGDTDRAGQWTIYGRLARGADFGLPVASGDFNGDGFDDVILTPMTADTGPSGDRGRAGEAIIVLSDGTIGGVIDLATIDLAALPDRVSIIFGADDRDYLGAEVFGADLDGDGYDEAIIGVQQGDGENNARLNSGEVVIVWGHADIGGHVLDMRSAAGTEAVTIVDGADEGDRLGVWVSSGDVDGDGTTDAILGADQGDGPTGLRPNAGETIVLYGGAAVRARRRIDLRNSPVPTTVIYGIDPQDHSGCTVRGFDLNHDGAADVLIGAGLNRLSATADFGESSGGGDGPLNDRFNAGEAYVVYGAVGQRPATIDLQDPPPSTVMIYGVDPGDSYGEELFGGDFNGDGQGDVAIGALTASGLSNIDINAGEMALILGSASFPGRRIDLAQRPAGVTTVYGAGRARIAGDTAMLVDINGDGRDDLAIGSPQDIPGGRTYAGTVDVLFGTDAPLPQTISLGAPPPAFTPFQIAGNEAFDMLAYSAAFGDVDGDGISDLIINAMGADGFENKLENAANVYVLSGPRVSEAARPVLGLPTLTPTSTPTATTTPTVTPTFAFCPGDCDDDGTVTVDDLVKAVNVVLELQSLPVCELGDTNGDGFIMINELVQAVAALLDGC